MQLFGTRAAAVAYLSRLAALRPEYARRRGVVGPMVSKSDKKPVWAVYETPILIRM
jgi:hypothetical protein